MAGPTTQGGRACEPKPDDLQRAARRAALYANAAFVEADQLPASALRDLEEGALRAIRQFQADQRSPAQTASATADELSKIADDATLQVDRRKSLRRRLTNMSDEAGLWLYAVLADGACEPPGLAALTSEIAHAGPDGEDPDEAIGRRLAAALEDAHQQQAVRRLVRGAAQRAANELPGDGGKAGVRDWQDTVRLPQAVRLIAAAAEVWRTATQEAPWAGSNPRKVEDTPGPPFWIFVGTLAGPLPVQPAELVGAYGAAAGWGIARGSSVRNQARGPGRPRKTATDFRPTFGDALLERKPRRRRRGLTWAKIEHLAGTP